MPSLEPPNTIHIRVLKPGCAVGLPGSQAEAPLFPRLGPRQPVRMWQAGHRSHFVLRLHRASRLFLRTVTFTALLCHCPPPGAFPTPLRRHRDAAAAAAVTGQLTLRAPGQLPSCWDWGPLVPSPGLGTQRTAGRGAESCALVPNYTKTTCTNWLKSMCNTRISRSTSGRRAL